MNRFPAFCDLAASPLFSQQMRVRTVRVLMWSLSWIPLLICEQTHAEEPKPKLNRITYTSEAGETLTVEVRIEIEAEDGGLLAVSQDGQLHTITPEQLKKREPLQTPFTSLSRKELSQQLLREFGTGFEIIETRHYLICTNAGKVYATWCGSLLERLHSAFETFWNRKPLSLRESEFPLVAIIFANQQQFANFAAKDAGPATTNSKGYFSAVSNRIILSDLTATANSQTAQTIAEVKQKVAAAPFNVATVIHEATHQMAFNSGLHRRYADNPMWLTEGLAMYFEPPDLRSRNGWRTIGRVNPFRTRQLADYINKRRPVNSLETLIRSDERFRNPETAADAYAEAWALTYFLIKTRREEYAKYLLAVSQKSPLVWDKPTERLTLFQQHFGDDLQQLDRAFLKYLRRAIR